MFRLGRALRGSVETGSYRQQFDTFRKVFPAFWPFMRDAQIDLSARLEDREMPVQTAFALLLHEDIEAGDMAIERDRERLRGYGLLDS